MSSTFSSAAAAAAQFPRWISATAIFVYSFFATKLLCFFRSRFIPQTNFIISEKSLNAAIFEAAQIYLPAKINDHKKIANGQQISDHYDGIPVEWRLVSAEHEVLSHEICHFDLTFPDKFEDQVLCSYLQHVLDTAAELKKLMRIAKEASKPDYHFNYITTFDSLLINPELQRFLIEDLDQFLQARDHYRELGETWKRGYLFAGPASGKSILIQAIVNYTRFDVFHYSLADIYTNTQMQEFISSYDVYVPILVTVDIDSAATYCNGKSLSDNVELLNILWSCSGDDKIMILTTNNERPLDPVLLEQNRWMDVHLNLSRGIKKLPMKYNEGDTDLSRLGHDKEIENEEEDEKKDEEEDGNEEPKKEEEERKDEDVEPKKKKKKKRKKKKQKDEKNQPAGWMSYMLRLLFKN